MNGDKFAALERFSWQFQSIFLTGNHFLPWIMIAGLHECSLTTAQLLFVCCLSGLMRRPNCPNAKHKIRWMLQEGNNNIIFCDLLWFYFTTSYLKSIFNPTWSQELNLFRDSSSHIWKTNGTDSIYVFFLVEDQYVLLQMFANEHTSRICGPHLRSTEICPVMWPVSFG